MSQYNRRRILGEGGRQAEKEKKMLLGLEMECGASGPGQAAS